MALDGASWRSDRRGEEYPVEAGSLNRLPLLSQPFWVGALGGGLGDINDRLSVSASSGFRRSGRVEGRPTRVLSGFARDGWRQRLSVSFLALPLFVPLKLLLTYYLPLSACCSSCDPLSAGFR